ncbi:DUF418 domain-containing protein [Ideonella sp.]|uniref:DUF418 domain-containing protein n=1 Tax=Ideonella sp. TaxID=1929293 RepID=UPI0037C0D8DD
MNEPAPPVLPAAPPRQWGLDALRGLALGGILVVNIQWFSSAYQWRGLPEPSFVGDWDVACRWLISLLFEGKFYPLFSFLFGYSLVLQLGQEKTPTSVSKAKRRQWALIALGVAHAALLFPGDVLLTYGVLGALVLRWRGWAVARRLKVAFSLWLLLTVVYGTLPVVLTLGGEAASAFGSSGLEQALAQAQAAQQALQVGGWPMHQQRLTDWAEALPSLLLLQVPSTLMWMLLGSAAAQSGDLRARVGTWSVSRGLFLWGLGVLGAWLYARGMVATDGQSQLVGVWALVALGPMLSAAYLWLMVRAWDHPGAQRWLQPLAQAGRMSLTLYLSQSLICALLFTGYGLGWVGQLTLAQTLGVAAAIYAVQVAGAGWWLTRYSTGPLEALMQRWLSRPQPPSP